MATNKRKEAAALFELIDKSTLKVPKNAGALKIPSWWSSKSNPSTQTPPSNGTPDTSLSAAPAAPANGQTTMHRTMAAPRAIARSSTPPASTSTPSPVADILPTTLPPSETAGEPVETGQQHRLFEPPPANSAPPTPAATPSIRPPMPNLPPPVSPSVKSPPPAPAMSPPAAATAAVTTAEDSPEEAVVAPAARPFAPQTHAQGVGSRGWTPPRASLARVPLWGLAAGGALIVILVCLLIVLIMPHGSPQKAAGSSNGGAALPGDPGRTAVLPHEHSQQSLIPQQGTVEPPPPHGNVGSPQPVGPAIGETPGSGKAYGPGEVARSPDLNYVLIAQTPDRQIAERNANFIAQNGVDVSVEVMPKGLFGLISVQGFRTLEEGEATRVKIVQIGHLLPEYKKTRKAWDDAMLRKFKRPSPAG